MTINVFTLNAFAKSRDGGNPAGVVLNADGFTEKTMKNIANEVGFSETAFIQKSNNSDIKIRFFTPTAELDLCGHATIAAFSLLNEQKILQPGIYTQETKAGILRVEIGEDKTVFMDQNIPGFYESVDKQELADSLNIPEEYLMDNVPARVVSTGLRDIIVPVKTLEALLGLEPDYDKIAEISKRYNAVGYHVFSPETIFATAAHCRNFAPLYGIPEEAATGTANGALGCFMYHYSLLSEQNIAQLVFEQGYVMERPSEIITELYIQNNEITKVRVGGTARDIKQIQIELP